MNRIRQILFYWQGEPPGGHCLGRVESLARSTGAALTLVDAVSRLPRELLRLVPSQGTERLAELAMNEAHEKLLDAAARLQLPSGSLRTKVLRGPVVEQLLEEAAQGGYDLLILSPPRRRSFWRRWAGRDDTERLVWESPIPVLLLRERLRPRAARVLAAVNLTTAAGTDVALSDRVLNWAAAVARAEGSQLHVASCWNLAGESWLAPRGGLPRRQHLQMLVHERRRIRAALGEFMQRCDLGGLDVVMHLPKGDAGEWIPLLAGSIQADLLVMGMPARTRIRRFLLGNLADDILHAASCPVLAVPTGGLKRPGRRRAA